MDGIKNTTIMEKRDISVKQIKAAARHYNKGDYICCITLSGAAEEILGKIATKRTQINHFKNDIEFEKSIYEFFTGKTFSDKEIIKRLNRIKNELKHNDSGQNEWVEGDFENEAARLFVKAVKNYFDCYKEFPNDRIVKSLFEHLTL